jgi:hypothetical protein
MAWSADTLKATGFTITLRGGRSERAAAFSLAQRSVEIGSVSACRPETSGGSFIAGGNAASL